MRAILVACFLAAVCLGWLFRSWLLLNVVETGRTPEYPDLVPRSYAAQPAVVFHAALHAVNRLPRWSLRDYDADRKVLRAEARTRLLGFVDDIEVHVTPGAAGAVVSVRSASRIGRGDFGQNARNIRAFFWRLEKQLGQAGQGS